MKGYAAMLARGLRSRGHQVEIVRPPLVLGRLPIGRGEIAKWIEYIDMYVVAPAWLRWKVRKAEVVHVCDHSNSMYLRCAGRKPQIITCHDLLAINAARGKYSGVSVRFTGRIQQRWIAHGLERARYVICDSHKTETDFRELFGPSANIRVIHIGLSRPFSPVPAIECQAALATKTIPPGTRYLLHVGGNNWYKNRLAAMQIFAELRRYPEYHETILVLAGAPWTEQMHAFSRTELIRNAVVEMTDVSDSTLNALYSGAEALLFPSREEGFGWPILEAQACGCPVITTNRPPMTAVAGDAAIFIDPSKPEIAAQEIRSQWSRRSVLRALGFANLERFSTEKMMDLYVEAYEELTSSAQAVR